MTRRGGRCGVAWGGAFALVAISLLLNGCAAAPTAECAQARAEFEAALPTLNGFHPGAGDVVPAIIAGVALAAVEQMPDDAGRERCYDEIMRGRFLNYPPYAEVE